MSSRCCLETKLSADAAGRGEVAHQWPWPGAALWLRLDRPGLFTCAQTLQGQLTRGESHGDLGERKHRTVSSPSGSFPATAAPVLSWGLHSDRPSPPLLCRGFTDQSEAFSAGDIAGTGAACPARGILLERSTALGREALETPVGTRALKARALFFLKAHKGALFPATRPSSPASRACDPEFLCKVCPRRDSQPSLFCALIRRSTLSRVWVHLSFLEPPLTPSAPRPDSQSPWQ